MNGTITEIADLNHADRDASVKLVSIKGTEYVLKTDDLREIVAQKYFNEQLERHHVPALAMFSHSALRPNQMLLEYIQNSLTLGNALTEDRCRAWGKLVAQVHAIKVKDFFVFTPDGNQKRTTWQSYIKGYINTAVARHRSLPYSLGDDLIGAVQKILYELVEYQPSELSVTHGDLHVHNVLMRGDELVLFDKFADFPVAPPAFDIGLFYAEAFSGVAYSEIGLSTVQQQRFFRAFMDGYGPLSSEQQKWLDYFTLLRAFYRWPNRFSPHSGEVIRLMAQKLY